ncbi:hypothetical protein Ddye_005858 [Dipteronia dyeriana]|uniref:Uncharacterized protein n=1 Tax=Dipteronia dyeriana TaxID=168575 RepID=A0AAD9XGX2_9ROSI|nr:hypothetical protein Ddye_005858 [Dipteronia dyeriana]
MKKRFHRKDVAAIMDKAARSYTKLKYNRHMEELRNLHENAFNYVIEAGPHKWSRPGRLARATNSKWSCFHVHTHLQQQGIVLLRNIFWVLTNEFDTPCNCCCRDQNLDYISLCTDFYKRQTLIDAYSVPIMPVDHPSEWIVPIDITDHVVLNSLSRRQAGRPMGGRHALSSKKTTTQSSRRCGESSHNARRCHNPPLINDGPSRIVPPEYWCKCSICHSIGHNKQTCRDNGPT